MTILIRALQPQDYEAVLKLTNRLSEFDLPEWRQTDQIDQTNLEMVRQALAASDPDNAIYVAENKSTSQVVGYIRLQRQTDYFSGQPYGYIANIAVDQAFEGRGIGRKLLEKAEKWAQAEGFDQLRLHVFEENQHAQKVYEKIGFQKNIIDYIKVIQKEEQH